MCVLLIFLLAFQFLPTRFLPLGADVNKFHPSLFTKTPEFRDVVFVGSAGAVIAGSKMFLEPILRATMRAINRINESDNDLTRHSANPPPPPLRLVIYGKSWDHLPEFSQYYEGVLPQEDLPKVYQSAFAVIGVTMDGQRVAGMVNNRVYEVSVISSSSHHIIILCDDI